MKEAILVFLLNYPNYQYDLILSDTPSDVFKHYNVKEMHGLSLAESEAHPNTSEDSYAAGWCNLSPSGRPFVFINLKRCTNDVKTTALVMHEMCHLFFLIYPDSEDKIIESAEEETYKVVNLIKPLLNQTK